MLEWACEGRGGKWLGQRYSNLHSASDGLLLLARKNDDTTRTTLCCYTPERTTALPLNAFSAKLLLQEHHTFSHLLVSTYFWHYYYYFLMWQRTPDMTISNLWVHIFNIIFSCDKGPWIGLMKKEILCDYFKLMTTYF